VATLSPTLVVPIITEIAAERRMYLPMAGLVALFVAGGFEIVHRLLTGPNPRSPAARSGAAQIDRRAVTIVGAAGVLLSIGYCMLDARRLAMFETPLALWQDALVHQPGSSISQFNVGITLQTLGRQQEAIPHFEEAIRIKPDDGGTHNNLGFALMMVGRAPEAIPHIEKAIALKPDSAAAQNNLGMVLTNLGRPSEAIPHFQKALALKPKYAEAAVNLGVLLGRAGQPQAAVDQLEQALAWDPLLLDAFAPLTTAYMDLGQTATAVATAERAVAVARSLGRNDVAQQFTAWLAEHRSAAPAK
jgi:tetratricopeptide (TPR) repeat protein